MNAAYPTDNEWGIPSLRLDMQAERVELPVVTWGSRARGSVMTGCWSFYTDDSRWSALERSPLQLVATGCKSSIELNFSLFDQTPRAEALWSTYRKRLVSRQWQDAGIRVFVDLNVPAAHRELCLLGVPAGWRSFATRGYARRLDDLRGEWECAHGRAGDSLVLLVFGGGPKVEAECRSLPGAVYVPSHLDVKLGVARGAT